MVVKRTDYLTQLKTENTSLKKQLFDLRNELGEVQKAKVQVEVDATHIAEEYKQLEFLFDGIVKRYIAEMGSCIYEIVRSQLLSEYEEMMNKHGNK